MTTYGSVWRDLRRVIMVIGGVLLGCIAITALLPGDPAEILLRESSEAPSEAKIEALRHLFGTDSPAATRAVRWLRGVFRLDFGTSYRTGEKVFPACCQRLFVTATLALTTLAWVIPLSLFGGWYSLSHKIPEIIVRSLSFIGIGVPEYLLGPILLSTFSVSLRLTPLAGLQQAGALILPSITLGIPLLAFYLHLTRALFSDILSTHPMQFAYAKGLSPSRLFFGHLLPSSLPPLVVLWTMTLGRLLGGVIIVETIFGLPGLGRFFVEAVLARDYPVMQAVVLWSGCVFATLTYAADTVLWALNPKARERLLGGREVV